MIESTNLGLPVCDDGKNKATQPDRVISNN
jgi:hypothetical protein